MSRRRLPRRPVKRFAQLAQVFGLHARPMVAHAHDNPLALTRSLHLDRLAHRVEALGIAQQVVHGALDHGRPAGQVQLWLGVQAHALLR
jgi:hypothetical protein